MMMTMTMTEMMEMMEMIEKMEIDGHAVAAL
jgi:hypothetical protein